MPVFTGPEKYIPKVRMKRVADFDIGFVSGPIGTKWLFAEEHRAF